MVALLAAPAPASAQVGINVYGLSRHFGNLGDYAYHEFNPGLGLHWTFDRGPRSALELNVGGYRDSFGGFSRHVALGARVRLAGPLELGLQAELSQTPALNAGDPFLAPVPFLAWRMGRVVLNAYVLPQVGSLEGANVVGLGATVFPRHGGFAWDDPRQRPVGRRSTLEFAVTGLPRLAAYDGFGIAWRRMFSPRHGLRLGFDLDGRLETYSLGPGDRVDRGEYRVTLGAAHYWRRRPAAGLGWYTTEGVRLRYEADEIFDETQVLLTARIGVAQALGGAFAAFAEYGVTGGWAIEHLSDGSDDVRSSTWTTFGAAPVRLGISANL